MPSPGVNTGIGQNVTIPRGVTIYLREIGGGITAMMTRWAESQPGGASVSFVLLRDTNRPFTPLDTGILSRASRTTFNGALDNRYLVYREMSRWLKDSDDIIVANDALELGMVSALGTRNPIAFVLHGDYDYYYDLAVGHESRIGSFLCVSDAIRETLARKIPHRAPAIHVTYPVVPESVAARSHSRDHLRLLFVGRLTEEKGFWDLPLIDTELQRAGVDVRWTIVAPREPSLNPDARRWLSSPHVKHIASVPLAGMDAVYATHDLLVFPSRFEGFGIAVLEAMKAGVVPVAARLKAGLPEMIDDGVSGFLIEPGDSTLAAGRISLLSADQGRLDAMSAAARQSSNQRFDANSCAEAITAAVLSAKYVPPRAISPSYLSRLDRPWIPNRLVRLARRTRGRTLPPELPG